MSVLSLSTTRCNVYSAIRSQDKYGTVSTSYLRKYTDVPCRVCYADGKETVQNGKISVYPDKIIYISNTSLDILESDLIMDVRTGMTYDVLYANNLYGRHWRIFVKVIAGVVTIQSSSSSSSESSSSQSSISSLSSLSSSSSVSSSSHSDISSLSSQSSSQSSQSSLSSSSSSESSSSSSKSSESSQSTESRVKIYQADSYVLTGSEFAVLGGAQLYYHIGDGSVWVDDPISVEQITSSVNLDGAMDLSGLIYMTDVALTNNSLSAINLAGCSALTSLNLSGDDYISDLDLTDCAAISTMFVETTSGTAHVCGASEAAKVALEYAGGWNIVDCPDESSSSSSSSMSSNGYSDSSESSSSSPSSSSSSSGLPPTPFKVYQADSYVLTGSEFTFVGGTPTYDYINNAVYADNPAMVTQVSCAYNATLDGTVDISGLPNITNIDTTETAIATLDCHGCTLLAWIAASGNTAMTSLIITGCTAIFSFDISGNSSLATSIDVSAAAASLGAWNLYGTAITAIDITGCASMFYINVSDGGSSNTAAAIGASSTVISTLQSANWVVTS